MNTAKRLPRWRAIILLVLASFLLAACSGQGADTNWPGMSADDQGVVYVAYGPGVIAVDVAANEQLWFFPQAEGNSAPIYASPTVVDGKVVFGDYGVAGGLFSPKKTVSVYSLDASDGTLNSNWPVQQLTQDKIIAPALIEGDRVFFGTADNNVFAMDLNSAETVWPQSFEADHSIWGMPTYNDGVLYVPSLDRNVYALDANDGSVVWQTNVQGSVSDKAVKNSELVYVGSFDGHAYALDSQTGEIRWAAAAEDAVWGAPLYVDGVVYFADLGGNMFAVDAESGEAIWQSTGAGYVVARPVFVDGRIIIASAGDPNIEPGERTTGELIAYDAEMGDQLWRQPTKPLFTTPVVAGDTIVVAVEDLQTLLVYFNFDGVQTGTFARPTG